MGQLSLSWYEQIELKKMCWWRQLLRLPLKTESSWDHRNIVFDLDNEEPYKKVEIRDRTVSCIQLEEISSPSTYINLTQER